MASGGDAKEKEEIREIVRKINAAWQRGWPEELAAYFHEDMVIAPPGFSGRVKGREACVASYREFINMAKVNEYKEVEPEIDLWGNTAVATYSWEMVYELNGEEAKPGSSVMSRAGEAPVSNRIPLRVSPMLAMLVRKPFDKPGWTYEEKYDGFRILAYKEGEKVSLLSRNGLDRTKTYAHVAEAIGKLAARTLLLDGEIVAFDRNGVSRFQLLQEGKSEPTYAVFDCLYENGRDLRREPLSARRAAMEAAIGKGKLIFPSRQLAKNGLEAFQVAKKKGFEGLVAKDLSSPYVERRSPYWLKVKVHQEDEFIIAGYTKPEGSRKYFGALLLGTYEKEKLHYVGKVGTGFDKERLASLYAKFRPLVREKPSLVDPPREAGITYLAPQLIAQIAFQEWTADRKLRQPVYLGLRDDKSPEEVLLPAKGTI
jgi:bifunctional non-homologous end joining protein LigD